MKTTKLLFGILTITTVSATVPVNSLLPQASAQPIAVPQPVPYTNDAHTLLLEHFDGTTSGSPNGSVTYTNGVFGQAVHLNAGSWVSWNLGALSQGTVEFWGTLDTLTNVGGPWPSFICSCYSQFYATTFNTYIVTNSPVSAYHIGFILPDNWIGSPWLPSPVITANSWHHYATTWGSQGFHFYVDGTLVYSNTATYGQNTSTRWWCIGGQTGVGPAYGGDNFTGAIDELRISNIQRTFAQAQSFLTNGLVAYYPFNGNADDATGNGNNGTVNGAVLASDRFGNANSAYSFDGTNDYIRVARQITTKQPFTWSTWLRLRFASTNVYSSIMNQGGNPGQGGDSPEVDINGRAAGRFALWTYTTSGYLVLSEERASYDTNNWYHLVVTSDATGNRCLYVDGVCEGTATNQSFGQDLPNFYIGGLVSYLTNYFAGEVDDVRIYNRALSGSEVQELYAYESTGSLAPLTATASAQVDNGFLVGATITDSGYGYTNTPTVRIIGGGGSGAQAVAVVSNGVVIAVNVLDAGSGYTNTPVIVIDPPFIPNPVLGIAPMSFVIFSNLTVGGVYQLQQSVAWYWSNQPVSFTATNSLYRQMVPGVADSGDYRLALNPVPVQAFATAVVSYGFVVHATVTSGGSGYVSIPAVTIVGGGGSNATAVAQISGGVVTNITITSNGAGYTNTPLVEIAQPPVAAVSPNVLPMMRVDSASLAPYDNYRLQFKPDLGAAWSNWDGGLFSPTAVSNSQYLFITSGVGFFRLQYVP